MDTAIIVRDSLDGLFLIALIISVIIAYGVQFMLSLLSLATGVSLTPNLKKAFAKMKAKKTKRHDRIDYHVDDDDDDDHVSSVMITSGIGFWVLLTSSLALLAGTYFGFNILPLSPEIAMIGALVVWSLFFISLIYLEYKAVHTVLGGLMHTALGGLRSSASLVKGIVTPSDKSHMEKAVRGSVHAVYDEVDRLVRKDNLDKRIEKYIGRLTPDLPTKKDVSKELRNLINQLEVHERVNITDDEVERVLDLQLSKNPKITKEKADRLKESLKSTKRESDKHDNNADKLLAVIDHIAPVSDEDAKEHRLKIAEILDKTSKDELDSEQFKADLEKAFDDPKAAKQQIIARLKHFDRRTVKEIIAELSDMDKQKSDAYVDRALAIFDGLMHKNASEERKTYKHGSYTGLEARIAAYFDDLEEPDLDYDAIKHDVQEIMESPSSAPQVVRDRLHKLDRSTVVSLLSSNSRISHNQAERIADKIIEAKAGAGSTLDKVVEEVDKRMQFSQRKAIIIAEKARVNTVTASWWLFASAVISLAMALLGAYLATM